MFLLPDGGLLLNEVAPRPHNSGHYTIEGCAISQYEQHLRAVMGWPLGSADLIVDSWWVLLAWVHTHSAGVVKGGSAFLAFPRDAAPHSLVQCLL